MATIGRILVDVAARTASFEKAMTNVQRQLAGVQKMASQFGSVLAGAGVIAFVQQAGDAAEKVLQLSDRLGMTTDELQRLQFVAEQSGLSFEQLAGGVSKMQKNAYEAATGSTSMAEAFNTLGIEAGAFVKLNAGQQLASLADAFSKIQNPSQQTALAMTVFGKSGADLLPILADGSAGIRELASAFDRLGVAMSRETLEKLDRSADSIAQVGLVSRNAAASVLSSLAPALDGLGKSLAGLSAILTPIVNFLVNGFLGTLYTVAGATTSIFYEIYNALARLPGRLGASFSQFRDFLGELQIEYTKAADAALASALGIEKTGKAASDARPPIEELTEQLVEVEVTARRISGSRYFDQFGRDITTVTLAIQRARSEWEAYESAIDSMPEIESTVNVDEIEAKFDGMFKNVEQMTGRSTQVFGVATAEWTAMADEAARSIQGALADFLFDPFEDGIKGMLRGFVNVLRRMVAEAASAQILKALGGFVSGMGGGFFGFLGGVLSGRANGGPVSAGVPYIVGERGRELFIPGQSGAIVPNHRLAGGGVTINMAPNIVINGDASLEKKLPAILSAWSRQTVELARRQLNDDVSRGAFGRA